MKKKILCIIPARGESKRLPQKNLLPIGNKPLIAHSIEHALQSQHITKVVVSTDNPEIEQVSKACGAEVIRRPAKISGDHATSESALLHALNEVRRVGFESELIVFLQCTSPVRKNTDIDKAIEKLIEENADSLFSACRNDRFFWRKLNGQVEPINYDYRHRVRDQDHPEEYEENGSIFVFKPEILEKYHNRLGGKITVYEMDYWASFQIDSPEDAQLINWIFCDKVLRLS